MEVQRRQTIRQVPLPANKRVDYFCHLKIDNKHVGAILVTNQIGVPLEFKYTEPVATTKLHKVLYGAVLERYIHETVVRERLWREIRVMPEYFLTPYEDKEHLGLVACREMMAVQRCSRPQGESAELFTRVRDHEALLELEDGQPPPPGILDRR